MSGEAKKYSVIILNEDGLVTDYLPLVEFRDFEVTTPPPELHPHTDRVVNVPSYEQYSMTMRVLPHPDTHVRRMHWHPPSLTPSEVKL